MNDIALATAFRYLKGAEKTEAELRAHLTLKGITPGNVERVVEYCLSKGYVSDDRVAARAIELAQSRILTGRNKIGELLTRRGIDADVVEQALKSYPAEEERNAATEFLRRKLAPSDSAQKAARMLATKGFSDETVRATLEKFFPDLEW